MNLYEWLKLPDSIVVGIVTGAAVLCLAPYFGGRRFLGLLAVPKFPARAVRVLRWVGWAPLVCALGAFVPFIREPEPPSTTFDVAVHFKRANGTLDCAALTKSTAVLTFDAAHVFRATVEPTCVATMQGIPNALARSDAGVDLTPVPSGLLLPSGRQIVTPGAPLDVALNDAATVPRLRVSMLPPTVTDSAMQTQFLQTLVDESTAVAAWYRAQGPDFEYVNSLKVAPEGPAGASPAELRTFWDLNHALQLVRADVDPSSPTTVRTVIYLGDLAPAPTLAMLEVDMPIRAASLVHNQDSFSLLTLYVLARDAQRTGQPKNVVAAFLSGAFSISQQLGPVGADLATIEGAVKNMLETLKAGSPQ